MDDYQSVAAYFQATIEVLANSVDTLAEPLQLAAQLMTTALVHDKKIVVCGNGANAALAQLFATDLLHRFEQERPALPALCLSADAATISGIAQSSSFEEIYSHQLRALAQSGDILLCIADGSVDENQWRAIRVARDRNMPVVLLSNSVDGESVQPLLPDEVMLCGKARQLPHAMELKMTTLQCLCHLIEQGLFGGHSRE